MTETVKVILKLKEPVTDVAGNPVKNLQAVKRTKPDGTPKTMLDIEAEAKPLMRGELLSLILMNGIKPKTAQEAADLNRLSKSINNLTAKDKGEWNIDESLLKRLEEYVNSIPPENLNVQEIGEVYAMFEEAKKDLFLKQRNESQK